MIIVCCFMKMPVVCSLSMFRYHDMGGLEEDEGLHRTVDAEFHFQQLYRCNSEEVTTYNMPLRLPPAILQSRIAIFNKFSISFI